MGTRGSQWTGEPAGKDHPSGLGWGEVRESRREPLGLLRSSMKFGASSLPFLLFCAFANLQVRYLQAASPEPPRGCDVEGNAVQILGRELRGLARRRGVHQQLLRGPGPQPAAAVS